MRDETKPHVVETPDQDPRGEDSSRTDTCSSETVQAVAPNEVTAGLEVTRIDVDERWDDMPPMFELHQDYPAEDDVEGDSVYIHGEHAVLEVIGALSELLAGRFEEVPWKDA